MLAATGYDLLKAAPHSRQASGNCLPSASSSPLLPPISASAFSSDTSKRTRSPHLVTIGSPSDVSCSLSLRCYDERVKGRITQLQRPHFGRDILIIATSISLAVFIAQHDLVARFMNTVGFLPVEAFIAGFFFTSLLTLAPAGVAFAEMAQAAPAMQLAAWGAAGAVIGDLLLFFFVRDAISDDVMALLRGSWLRKIKVLFKTPFLSWAVPVAGALVIASPLPDEVGLAMLGLSKTDLRFLILVSYAMNFLGILIIALAVHAG